MDYVYASQGGSKYTKRVREKESGWGGGESEKESRALAPRILQ